MNECWQNDDYLILFTEDESLAAAKAYSDHHLPGYTLLGRRGWDDFIVINSSE